MVAAARKKLRVAPRAPGGNVAVAPPMNFNVPPPAPAAPVYQAPPTPAAPAAAPADGSMDMELLQRLAAAITSLTPQERQKLGEMCR